MTRSRCATQRSRGIHARYSSLYAGGSIHGAGGGAANNIAQWDGTSWSSPGVGAFAPVYALAVFDDGGGRALYAAGSHTATSFDYPIARWNGASWKLLQPNLQGAVHALTVFDESASPRGSGRWGW